MNPYFKNLLRGLRKVIGVTVLKYFDPFKVIAKQAVKDGYLEKDPFLYVKSQCPSTGFSPYFKNRIKKNP